MKINDVLIKNYYLCRLFAICWDSNNSHFLGNKLLDNNYYWIYIKKLK